MGLGRTRSVALTGLDGALVQVEADIAQGLPHFAVSGLPDTACLQSTDRVKAGSTNSGLPLPQRRITVNLSPASIPKAGTGFDLAIAVASLVAARVKPVATFFAVAATPGSASPWSSVTVPSIEPVWAKAGRAQSPRATAKAAIWLTFFIPPLS